MFFPHLLHIQPSDLVLEIGPGGFPFWRADCLADKYDPADEVDLGQYGGKQMDLGGKPLFKIIDGKLPFKDNSFDYIVCSHVLEHVSEEELPVMISEMNRVGKRKYIEFPTALYDYIYNFGVHTNFLDIIHGTIVCLPKNRTNIAAMKPFTDYAMQLRKVQKLGLEITNLTLFGAGQEYNGPITWKFASSAEEFFSLVSAKYAVKLQKEYPGWGFRIMNQLGKLKRKITGEKSKDYFNALLNQSK